MQFITSLFSGSGNSVLTAVFALGVVLVLIVLAVWLLKVISEASGRAARGRNRRLALVDSLVLDQKRTLLIIRRDNVEHLLLVGGGQDVVVEAGIAVEEPAAAQPSRRPIPMVPQRKPAPAPKAAPVAPAVIPEPPAAPGSALEQLRERGLPTNQRAHLSLRHTGLLRPVNDTADAVSTGKPDNSPRPAADSDKDDMAQRGGEGIDRVEDKDGANRI